MSGRAGVILAAALGLALVGVLAGLSGGVTPTQSFEPNAFSRSYVGHMALVEFLREVGFDVLVNRAPLDPDREGGIRGVAFLEPEPIPEGRRLPWRPAGDPFDALLVALPKWKAAPNPFRGGWIADRNLRSPEEVFSASGPGAPGPVVWAGSGRATVSFVPDGPRFEIEAETLQVFPDVAEDLVVARVAAGAVAVRDADREGLVWLSDPDVLSNGGLGRGENAAFVEALFSRAFPGRALIVDETHHGFAWNPGLLGLLVTFPGIVPVLATAFFLFLLGWALVNDWGGRGALPSLERSRLEQARNVGRLMVGHGRHEAGLALYVENVRGQLCEWFHFDRAATADGVAEYMARSGRPSAGAVPGFREAARASGRAGGGMSPSAVLVRARKVHDLLRRGHDDVRSRTQGPGRR